MSSAYVIADTRIKNAALLDEYRRLAQPSVLKFNGQYLVATDGSESLTGEWAPQRLAIVRFDSVDVARRWWDSAEYRDARALRRELGTSNILLVKGI